MDAKKVNRSGQHYIVAIGASAGGLAAIQQFFDNLDKSSLLSFIVIQHLSPNHKSLLVELVAKHTDLQVVEARHGVRVSPGHVYVIPPKKLIAIAGGELHLSEKIADNKPNQAINFFLESLALDAGRHAVAIILSGTGTDGSAGIEAVHQAGGLVLVQEPDTAQFNGMPESAVATGIADAILPPEEMPYEIMQRIAPDDYPNFQKEAPDAAGMEQLFSSVREATGCDFSYYKPPTILRRLARRMSTLQIPSFRSYLAYLSQHQEEAAVLCKNFLINVTRFFRDEEAYTTLREKVFPLIVNERKAGATIKIWIAACSTGEEAYTIAILLDAFLAERKLDTEVKIFATDIDVEAIDVAAKGVYPASIAAYVPAAILNEYFIKRDGSYTISPYIRKQIVFAKHDITNDPPFIRNDLVSCRNMLIYMNAALQKKVVSTLQYATDAGGFLMLGPTESAEIARDMLEEFDRRWKIFRKKGDRQGNTLSLIDYYSLNGARAKKKAAPAATAVGKGESDELSDIFLHELGYAVLHISSSYDIREASGAYERFLSLPGKKLQLNLLKMVSTDMAGLVTNAIHQARTNGGRCTVPPTQVRDGERLRLIRLYVRISDNGRDIMVVIGELPDAAPPLVVPQASMPGIGSDVSQYIASLEEEQARLRQSLHTAVEGLETANEELQSTNEELLSSNEELQSSNEELQSLNEELHTLNTEHQLKIQELILLNDDLNNYFRTTDIGQILVDDQLRIRKFNPAATRLINLIEIDIGRPILDIVHQLGYDGLKADLQHVLGTGNAVEREVAAGGRTSIMRVIPYVRIDGKNDGLVITFVDITAQKELDNIIQSVFDASPSAILAMKAVREGGRITSFSLITANRPAFAILSMLSGTEEREERFARFLELQREDGLFQSYARVVEEDIPFHTEHHFGRGKGGWYEIMAVKMDDGMVITLTDISNRKESENQLRAQYNDLIQTRESLKALTVELEEKVKARTEALAASEERLRLISEATNDALWDWNIINNSFWWSPSFYSQFGYSDEQLARSYSFWISHLHPDELTEIRKGLDKAINRGLTQWSAEHRFQKADGSYAKVLNRAYILQDEYGTPYRVLGSMLDISSLRAAQEMAATTKAYSVELEQMNSNLEKSNYALQQFASVASHDLKEPLRKIQVFSGLLKGQIAGNGDKAADYLERVSQSATRMSGLINDLLEFSSLSKKAEFVDTDLNEILAEVLSDLEVSIKEKQVSIDCQTLPTIEAVPGQLRQVFQNIISNAIKFTRKDETPVIRIDCRSIAESRFDSPTAADGWFTELSITDNGIGFDMAYLSKIFIIFQRLNDRESFQGSGIGLAIVKKIIENHNGLITAESVQGSGTTFRIILPVRQRESIPAGSLSP